MRNERIVLPDGAALARSVRAVAYRAQRTLQGPIDPEESQELLTSIDFLERAVEYRASEDLSKWLASLRRRVETRGTIAN